MVHPQGVSHPCPYGVRQAGIVSCGYSRRPAQWAQAVFLVALFDQGLKEGQIKSLEPRQVFHQQNQFPALFPEIAPDIPSNLIKRSPVKSRTWPMALSRFRLIISTARAWLSASERRKSQVSLVSLAISAV